MNGQDVTGFSAESAEDAFRGWWAEASAIVGRWERESGRQMLSTLEAAELSTHIARALERAYEQGRKIAQR
jgi:hypothetical protein